MSASILAIRKWKLVLVQINKTSSWWAFAVVVFMTLIVFEIAAFDGKEGLRASQDGSHSPRFGRSGDDSF
jgi:hypothetical protein